MDLKTADGIDSSRLVEDVNVLSEAAFGGRRIGSPGHDRARDWIANRLEHLGYGVSVGVTEASTDVIDCRSAPFAAAAGAELRYRVDFAEHPRSAALEVGAEGPVRALGKGNVNGAWVVLDATNHNPPLDVLALDLAARGALGVLAPQAVSEHGYLFKRIAGSPVSLPVISIASSLLAKLDGQLLSARLQLRRVRPRLANVVGRLGPTDGPGLLIGAHYDAVGDDVGGERLPGASDNASGTAAVLEVARLLVEKCDRLKRSLLIAMFDGEEIGAAGSHALAAELAAEGSRSFVLNLDGAAVVPRAVAVEPSGGFARPLLHALDSSGRRYGILLEVAAVASDNRAFAAAGFGAAGVGLGLAAMHTPADTADRVDAAALRVAAKLILGTADVILGSPGVK